MKRQTFMKSTLCLLMALVCNVAWAQTPVLELEHDQISTDYPYELSETDAEKVFALEKLTVAVLVDAPATVSGRQALFATSDPTKATNSAAEGKNSRYVAYGMNGSDVGYLASWRDGDRFTGGSAITANAKNLVVVYVIDPENKTFKAYVNGVEKFSKVSAHADGFMSGYEIATPKMVQAAHANAEIYIGGGKHSGGNGEVFNGTIKGVKVFDSALSAEQIAQIRFPEFTEYTVDMSAGAFDGSGNYRTSWTHASSALTLTCPASNMNSHDGLIQLHSGQAGSSTYTLTVPAGYKIVKYSFDYAFGNSGTGDKKFVVGGTEYAVTATAQTLLVKNVNAQTAQFVLSGANEPVKVSNFVVEVKAPTAEEIAAAKATAKNGVDPNADKLGEALGYYSYTANGEKLCTAADVKTAIDAAETIAEINAIAESFALNIPEVGKYYRIKGISDNYIDAVQCHSGTQMGMKSNETCNYLGTIFLLDEGNRLKNVATGTYVHGTRHIGETKANANTWTFAASTRTLGCITLTAAGGNSGNSTQLHDNSGNRADRCSSICGNRHDFVIEEVEAVTLTINAPSKFNVSATWNGETKTLPATWTTFVGFTITESALSAAGNATYTFTGFSEGDQSLGKEVTIASMDADRTLTANFTPSFFGATLAEAVPVQIYNDDNNSYFIKLNAVNDFANKALNSGACAYTENEMWYFVGTPDNFLMYNHKAGADYAVKVAGTGEGSAATMVAVANATPLQLKAMEDGSHRIAPANSTDANVGFNMYGGVGYDIKLYNGTGSEWLFRIMSKNPLTINYELEGTQPLPTNTRLIEVGCTCNGVTGNIIVEPGRESKIYLPVGQSFTLTRAWQYRGYTFNGFKVGEGYADTYTADAIPAEGVTVSCGIDEANDYQYLYWYRSEDINAPYRIPAITVTKSGKVLAISDYRPCGDDIGRGEVDIMFRRSTESYDNWDKKSWTEMDYVADGVGGNENLFGVGYGDAAVVSDRESGKTLVMAVSGRVRFTEATTTSHPKVARIVTDNDGDTWEIADVTDQFIKDDDENSLFHGFCAAFITSGRILQSSTYKAPGAQYYRIYAVAAVDDDGDNTFLNHALYSDDFGENWKFLGGSRDAAMCCNAGNETTIEELPNGDLVVSVRKSDGRYFNVFSYGTEENDKANGIGEWEIKAGNTKVTSDFGSADCNGELLRVGNVLLHSHPKRGYQNKDRSNVAIFYKVLDPEKDYTAAEIATGWQELTQVSFIGSAYSTMTFLPDGKTVGFLYEEDPDNGTFAYCIVYKPIDLTELLTAEAQEEAFVVNSTIGQHEIGTFYANDAMVVPEGVTAYVATTEPQMDGTDTQGNAIGTITMTKIEDGIIPAHTGVLICGEPGTYAFKMADTEGETDVTNSLMPGYAGIYEHTDVALESGYTTYVLTVKNEVAGFYKKTSSFKVYNNKAYLQVPSTQAANLRIRFGKQEGTTGIESVELKAQDPVLIYDLMGRCVENPTKGIYIVNGKKVVIK